MSTYWVTVEGVPTELSFESTKDASTVSFKLTLIDQTTNQDNFTKLFNAVAGVKDAKFFLATIGKYNEQGQLANNAV